MLLKNQRAIMAEPIRPTRKIRIFSNNPNAIDIEWKGDWKKPKRFLKEIILPTVELKSQPG